MAAQIVKKLGKMSKTERELYYKQYSQDNDAPVDPEHDHGSSTVACSHGHTHKSEKPLKKMTDAEAQEHLMKEYEQKQQKIRENNMKATGGGWIIP